jgi:hypothetical protein
MCLPANIFPHTTNLLSNDLCKVGFSYVKSHLPLRWSALIQVCHSVELFEWMLFYPLASKVDCSWCSVMVWEPNIHWSICIITNWMHCLSLVYWIVTPLHVLGVSTAHHQEVECIYVANGTYYTVDSQHRSITSTISHIYTFYLMVGCRYAQNMQRCDTQ